MARNQEKAQSMLHRYLRSKQSNVISGSNDNDRRFDEHRQVRRRRRRPHLAVLCDDLDEAYGWERQVESEIRRHVDEIQNMGLEQGRVMELNDRINKLIRERRHWRKRIVELGGEEKIKEKQNEKDEYIYFGAARNLPGIKEILESKHDSDKNTNEFQKFGFTHFRKMKDRVDGFYMGIESGEVDEDVENEKRTVEELILKQQIDEWNKKHGLEGHDDDDDDDDDGKFGKSAHWDTSFMDYVGRGIDENKTEEQIAALTLERRKVEALQQFSES